MGTVADKLREVLSPERQADARGASILSWAESHGDDLRAAWDTCPRADHLVLVAGAFHAPLGALIRTAGRLLRPVAPLAPRREAAHVTRVAYAAEQWTGAAARPLRDVSRQLRAAATRARKEQDARGDRLLARSIAALTPLMKGPAERVVAALREAPEAERTGEGAARRAGEVLEVEVTRALAEADARGDVRAVADDLGRVQREQAGALALLAASELGDAVDTASMVLDAMRKLTAMGDADRAPDPARVRALAAEGEAFERSLYDDLARALSLSSEAAARDAAARWASAAEPGFRDTLARTVVEASLHVATRPGEPVAVLPLHHEVERVIAAERLGRLRSMADALRASVPRPSEA